ncbi:hypothetical protein ROZALSC1DRAFT_30343 [Rozella allomycis CSF55]|uniref:Dynein regulatory complex protein 1 n=1 Tax=Rozella allomycis (strain CSF55) TaxID=988480 RepID=A0A4P9YEN1_ROZAC|nr:hypothetical protein ROZALSC1DRAFT_30343 [Rozella allomycis CSF55]
MQGENESESSRPSSSGNNFTTKIESDLGYSDSRSQRIDMRKARIEMARQSKLKPAMIEESTKKKAVENEQLSLSAKQIEESRRRLQEAKDAMYDSVTNVRVAVEAAEAARRVNERRKSEERKAKIEYEEKTEKEALKKISASWALGETMKYPHSLRELLTNQKEECDRLIERKNKLAAEFIAELKAKDEEYVKELKRQTEEIDELLIRIRNHDKNFQNVSREELKSIEKAFMQERANILNEQSEEIQKLLNERRTKETIHDSEDYNVVKIKLETDVQVLEQQLQQMKATYQLNTEKLEYNYQVLKKRDDENMIIINHHKRKITKSTDILNNLKAKLAKQEKQYNDDYQLLAEEYKRLTEQVKQLEKKFHHFQKSDQIRFQQVWDMNEEDVKELMRKILHADQIIHQQHLNLPWKPPVDDIHYFNLKDVVPSKKHALLSSSDKLENNSFRVSIPILDQSYAAANEIILNQDISSISYDGFSKPIKKILDLLSKEASFLVEDKLNQLLMPLNQSEKSLMKLDSIFKALHIRNLQDIERLSHYFIKEDVKVPTNPKELTDEFYISILIDSSQVVKSIKKFVEDSKLKFKKGNLNALSNEILNQTKNHDIKATLDSQKLYWEKMKTILTDENYETWKQVYNEMQKYNVALTDRWKLFHEIQDIKTQNEELKILLRKYLTAKINDELQIPPTKVLLGA